SETRPAAAAIIHGAAGAYAVAPPNPAAPRPAVPAAVDQERARELRARGADMDWDQAIAYTLTQTTQALGELESQTQPCASCRIKMRILPMRPAGRARK